MGVTLALNNQVTSAGLTGATAQLRIETGNRLCRIWIVCCQSAMWMDVIRVFDYYAIPASYIHARRATLILMTIQCRCKKRGPPPMSAYKAAWKEPLRQFN